MGQTVRSFKRAWCEEHLIQIWSSKMWEMKTNLQISFNLCCTTRTAKYSKYNIIGLRYVTEIRVLLFIVGFWSF